MGLLLGLLGGGGSILIVPILVYLFQLPPELATLYSLFLVGATAGIGCLVKLRSSLVDFRSALIFFVPGFSGILFARLFILVNLPETILQFGSFILTKQSLIMIVFSGVMFLASFKMIFFSNKKNRTSDLPGLKSLVFIAFFIGSLMGFVGAGGGFLIVPVLFYYFSLDIKPDYQLVVQRLLYRTS